MRYEEAFPRMLDSALYEGKQAGNSSRDCLVLNFILVIPLNGFFFPDELSLSLIFFMLVLSRT